MKTSLPSVNSPLAQAVLEPLTAKLLQEHLRFKRIELSELAKKLLLQLPLLQDAIRGNGALKVGLWKAMQGLLEVKAEHYLLRPSERHNGEVWEIYNVYMVPSAEWRRRFPIDRP